MIVLLKCNGQQGDFGSEHTIVEGLRNMSKSLSLWSGLQTAGVAVHSNIGGMEPCTNGASHPPLPHKTHRLSWQCLHATCYRTPWDISCPCPERSGRAVVAAWGELGSFNALADGYKSAYCQLSELRFMLKKTFYLETKFYAAKEINIFV